MIAAWSWLSTMHDKSLQNHDLHKVRCSRRHFGPQQAGALLALSRLQGSVCKEGRRNPLWLVVSLSRMSEAKRSR